MQAWRRLRRWSMTSWIQLVPFPAHTSIRRYIKSFKSCIFVRGLVAELCHSFVVIWIDVRAVWRPRIWKFVRSLRLLHFRSGGSEWCTDCLSKHSGKEHSQKNLSKPILYDTNLYNQIASDVWETSSVYKLMTVKLQPVLINVLIRSTCEHWGFTR